MNSIVPPTPIEVPQPPSPSVAERQAQALLDLNAFSLSAYRSLVSIQRNGIITLWQSPIGLTPQQVCDAKGDGAAALFRDHGTLTAAIATIAQDNGINPITGKTFNGDIPVADGILFPSSAFTVNPDGTVTIHEGTPYTP